ncbi:ATP synthase E chain-domain-containing protein [Mycotypha africana]|uniref:ATP synthase E chain-domain-containing protein n=1 Tax=Mycotypha africana TaxID=64632 RepID=UPI00230067C0|nr:ATP synthase E chain-domain-containing protein [Mycotypha africana]KAI8991249.1 ATP synthase E chain-domain-containing protein [Mycotypha africana]
MVNSAVANVGRWSALAVGLFYGYTHDKSLHKDAELKKVEAEYRRKERLIEQARLEFAKKQAGAAAQTPATTDKINFDVDSPEFDLENYLQHIEKEGNQ